MIKFVIHGELMDLNKYINVCRANKFGGGMAKKKEQQKVTKEIIKQIPNEKMQNKCLIGFKWFTKDARKDVDNTIFAKKFILDALVENGVLIDDSRKYVVGIAYDLVYVDKLNPRIEVEILEV